MQQSVYHTCPRPPGNLHQKAYCLSLVSLSKIQTLVECYSVENGINGSNVDSRIALFSDRFLVENENI